jgi:hypothetical protein
MDYLNHHTMSFINHSITLTVYLDEIEASRELSEREILTIMGYKGVVYGDDTSLFCSACTVFATMDESELLEFLDYTADDWDNLWDFVESTYYDRPWNLVDCRKN